MLVRDAFEKFVKYQEAQNKPATVRSYVDRTRTFREGFGAAIHKIADVPAEIGPESVAYLVRGHGGRDVTAVTAEDVDDWLLVLQHQHTLYQGNLRRNESGGLSRRTIEGRKQALRYFFGFCLDRGYISIHPAAHIKKSRQSNGQGRVETISMRDVWRLFDAAAANYTEAQLRDIALLSILTECGARPGETAGLDLDSLDLDEMTLWIFEGKTGSRPIMISSYTVANIRRWLRHRELVLETSDPETRDDQALFVGLQAPNRGGRISAGTIYSIVERLQETAGITGPCHPYLLRHTFATYMANRSGVALHQVKELLGHADISTTQIYLHTDLDELRAIISLHTPLKEYYGQKGGDHQETN